MLSEPELCQTRLVNSGLDAARHAGVTSPATLERALADELARIRRSVWREEEAVASARGGTSVAGSKVWQ